MYTSGKMFHTTRQIKSIHKTWVTCSNTFTSQNCKTVKHLSLSYKIRPTEHSREYSSHYINSAKVSRTGARNGCALSFSLFFFFFFFFFFTNEFKSRTSSLISNVPNEWQRVFERLYTKHEERKQGLREETKAARVQTEEVERRGSGGEGREGLTRGKGEYKAIRYGYCESSSETRNPGAFPISSFALLRGLHSATPTGIGNSARDIPYP